MTHMQGAYARAGVDIEAANRTKQAIKAAVRSTFTPGVLGDIGGFGGLFAPAWGDCADPVLVGSVDGVGTKLKLAFDSGIHDTVGADLVSHCGNDILVQGARPLFFMDYLAMGRHDGEVAEAVVSGVARGCRQIGCALIGGETAEMPGFYQPGEYDLAGSIVGLVDRGKIIDGSRADAGDAIIGLASDGLHTNGFSLARRVVFEQARLRLGDPLGDTGRTVAEELLRPHRPYVAPVLDLLAHVDVKGMAHVTGGGFWDNLPRVLRPGVSARVRRGSWDIPPVFRYLQAAGGIEEREMYHVFNMGIGLVLFVAADAVDGAVARLRQAGEDARCIGEVDRGSEPVVLIA